MTVLRAFLKDNTVTLAAHLLVYARGVVLIPVLVKVVGVHLYGGYVLVATTLGLLLGVSSFGAGFRYRRTIPAVDSFRERAALFYPQFHFQMASAVCFSVVAVPAVYVLAGEALWHRVLMVLVPIYLVVFVVWSQTTDYFRYTGRLGSFNLSTLVQPYLFVLTVLVFVLLTQTISISELLLLEMLSMLVVTAPFAWRLLREIGWSPHIYSMPALVGDLRIGSPLLAAYVVNFVLSSSDRYVIAGFLGTVAVGHYSPGYTVGALIIFAAKASAVVLLPSLSRAVDEGREGDAHASVDYAVKIFLALSFPFVVGSYVLGEDLLRVLADAEVAEAARLVPPLVAVGMVMYGLTVIYSEVLFVLRETRVMLRVSAAAAGLNLILNLALLPLFPSITVPAVTTVVSYGTVWFYLQSRGMARWPIAISFRTVGRYALASAVMGTVVWLLVRWGWDGRAGMLGICVAIVAGVAVYGMALVALGGGPGRTD